ncbi:MAG: hypothetical protein IPK57_07255 [Chitinophagaceae bacterium]|nr:hypothetical protein [Chitinophagaceae bacterium]
MKIFFFAGLIIVTSCGGSVASKKLAVADSLVITFNVPNSDSVIKTVSTTEKKAIQKLISLVDGKEGKLYKCGYDGNMVFYSKGEIVLPVIFKYTEEGCRHFLFDMDNKVMSTEMTIEGAELLKSLVEGKEWY